MFETRQLSVRYGGVRALDNVSIRVAPGSVVGLIGANGAGKTTFVDAVTGFAASSGSVQLDGVELNGLPAHERTRLGLGRTWQAAELFEDLSIRDNLLIGLERVSPWTVLADACRPWRRKPSAAVDENMELLGLEDVADSLPSELPQGLRKLAGVGRALSTSPRVLLLDEPAAGLSTSETTALGHVLRQVASNGTGLLLVEHDVSLVVSVCDWIEVLDQGSILASGLPNQVRDDPRVIEAYLGHTADPQHVGDEA